MVESPPVSRVIVFVSGSDIRTVDAGGAHQALVHRVASGRPTSPCWSPDGKAIVWSWYPRGDIWCTSVSGAVPRQLLCNDDCGGACRNPKWSPCGHEIAVIADRERSGLPDAVLIVPTDEELAIARDTYDLVCQSEQTT